MKENRKKILVVEDDSFIRDIIKELLEMEGYEVFLAENGKVALEALKSTDFDLILLDLSMPVMDGYVFINERKNFVAFAHIPIVLMTADRHADIQNLLTNKDVYLSKPFEMDALYKAVTSCL